jgi:hypothetical protein
LAGVRQSIDRKLDYEFTNVIGTIRLLEHCRRMGIPHFVFASSSSVYGTDAPLPFSEDGVRSSWPSTGREKVPPRSTSVRAKITPSWTWPRQRLLYTFRGPALQILHLQLPTKTPHPADLPETRASLINTRKTLHWEPGIFFPIGLVSSGEKV